MAVLFSYILAELCNFHAQKKVMAVLIKNIRISTHVTLRYPRTTRVGIEKDRNRRVCREDRRTGARGAGKAIHRKDAAEEGETREEPGEIPASYVPMWIR